MGKLAFKVGGAILFMVVTATGLALDLTEVAQLSFRWWPLITFIIFAVLVCWIIYDKQHQIKVLTSGNNLEVRILPNRYSAGSPHYFLTPGQYIGAIFSLQIVNHSRNSKAYLDKAYLALERKQFPLRKKTLFSMPLEKQSSQIHSREELGDIEIEPLSKTPEYPISMYKSIPAINRFPRKSKLVIKLMMIGANRKIEHTTVLFTHDPKQVPDIPNWERL